jgi:GNAT superfamily N-acetyltransferase
MKEIEGDWKERLKELCIEEFYAMSRWIYQSGECYAAIIFEGSAPEMKADQIVGWACITWEDEPHPVLGVYVDEDYRKQGYAPVAVHALLSCFSDGITESGSIVRAVTSRWPKYKELIRAHGFAVHSYE